MRPKTKNQFHIVELSKKVKPLTKRENDLVYKESFGKYFTVSRKTVCCLECGEAWKPDMSDWCETMIDQKCPSCKNTLKHHSHFKDSISNYSVKFEVIGNYQLVRIFYSRKYLKRLHPETHYTWEVMRHWVREDGHVESLAVNSQSMSYYYDAWCMGGDLSFKGSNFKNTQKFWITPDIVMKGSKVHPILIRNGFSYETYNEPQHYFFSELFKNSKLETLLKSHLHNVMLDRSYRMEDLEKYWPQIKLCIRHHYNPYDWGIWKDHIDLLKYFEKDLHNPKHICPEDLREAHDELVERKEIILEKQRKEREEKQRLERLKQERKNQREYAKQKKAFFGLIFQEDDLKIKVLKSISEFKKEAAALKHCVFTNEYYRKPDSLILSARIKNVPIETIELDLKKMIVVQSRGKGNTVTPHHSQIMSLMKKNIPAIRKMLRESKKKTA